MQNRNWTAVGITAVVIGALVAALVVQHRELTRLRREAQSLRERLDSLPAPVDPVPNVPRSTGNGRVLSEEQFRELLRLRNEVATAREKAGLRREGQGTNETAIADASRRDAADRAWVEQVLNGPPTQQGMAAGALRGKLLRRELTNISPAELLLREELLKYQLNQTLERSASGFADFQSAFIQSTVGVREETRVQQIHDILQQTYEHAVANGLDIPSKPASSPEAWVDRRFALDRAATAQVQRLLTPEERLLFDRAFLGVMGVDLGGVAVDKSNYPRGFLGSGE